MFPIGRLLEEPPTLLAREAVWRVRKQWNKRRAASILLKRTASPVRLRFCPYYVPGNLRPDRVDRDSIIAFADLVCNGNFPVLGRNTMHLGLPPRWNVDFVSGKDWAKSSSYLLRVVRHDGSDVKVPWELSRLQFLPVLGKAFVLTKEARYRRIAQSLLSAWIDDNPVLTGVNWTAPMDSALRAMSICFLLNLLAPFDRQQTEWLERVTESLWQHLVFVEAHLEFSHVKRSNHYLSNILGLYCLSVFLEGKGMNSRRERYARLLEKEIFHQVREDGGDYESSTGYHILVMQMFTSAVLLMRASGREVPPAVEERLARMYRLAAALTDYYGRVPHIGDCDDGRVELLSDDLKRFLCTQACARHSLTIPGLLGIGTAFLRRNFGGVRQDAEWYGLNTDSCTGMYDTPRSRLSLFPFSGIAVAKKDACQAIFLAMPNGIYGKGSHTHNDKLSILVRLGSEELFCDAGTGVYTRDAEMRNRFRSTESHNAAMIDNAEQNSVPPGTTGIFVLGDEAQVGELKTSHDSETIAIEASHDGYKRLGVMHNRKLRLSSHKLQIEDAFTGHGRHRVQLNFTLPATWQIEPPIEIGREIEVVIRGPRTANLVVSSECELHLQTCATQITRNYGELCEAVRVSFEAEIVAPARLLTELTWEKP